MTDDPALQGNASPTATFKQCVQIGIVVADIDATIRGLSEVLGLGPWRTIHWPPPGREDLPRFYHGQPAHFTARFAFTEAGPVELELIQPLTGDSDWADFLREHGPGIHHIRFNTYDLDSLLAYLDDKGVEVAQHGAGVRPGTHWANLATQELLGFGIEVFKALPGTSGRTPQIVDGKVV
jgi:methylmalonyl-CoA/ethylmalonyl-CoA epimerase